MRRSRPLAALIILSAGTLTFACDSPTRPPIFGSIAPRINLVPAPEGRPKAVLTQVRATVSGPTNKIVNLTLNGSFWEGRADSLLPGTYSVTVEGLSTGEIERFGRNQTVNVAAGQLAQPAINFALVQTATAVISPTVSTAYAFNLHYATISGANGYAVQWSTSSTFASGNTEITDQDTTALVSVGALGTYHVRVRPIIPGATSAVKWSDAQSFEVVDDGLARTPATATSLTLASGVPDTVRNRNITAGGPESWYSFAARAGDTLRVETFAARLAAPSPLNTVVTLYRADGTTVVATNDNTTLTSIQSMPAAVGDPTTDSRVIAAVPATETYRVRVNAAANSVGNYMLVSELRRLPAAPSGLAAVAASPTSVDLSWTDNADNEADQRLERCAGAACTTFTEIATIVANNTVHTDNTVTAGETFRYRIRSRNAIGNSAYSNIVDVSTVVPVAPSGLSATTISATQIDLAWADNSNNEVSFRIEQCADAGCATATEIATVGPNVTTYAVTGLTINTAYHFRVRASNAVGSSAYTSVASANTSVPNAPSALSATAASTTQINLSWTDNSTAETGFQIQMCSSGPACTDFAVIGTVGANVLAFNATGLTASTTYRFRVAAVNVAGLSPFSNTANATTAVPLAASGLVATTVSGSEIGLTWTDNSDNETGFTIEACAGAACPTMSVIGTVAANVTAFQHTGLPLNESFTYRVIAVNNVGAGAPSNDASANTLLPTDVTNLVASTFSATQINLSWTDALRETNYRIERCQGVGCSNFTVLTTVGADVTAYNDASVSADDSYTYRVTAYNAAGSSAAAGPVTATTFIPATPTGLSAVVFSATQIDLAWTDAANNETGYRVQRCQTGGCSDFTQIAELPAGTTSYQNTGLDPDQSYTYRVVAFNESGVSGPSNTATAATSAPQDPTNLALTIASPTQLNLVWTPTGGNTAGFYVERCTGQACVPAQIDQTVATTYQNPGLTTDEVYTYRVRAFNAVGESGYSNTATIKLSVPPATTVAASTVSSTQIAVTWADPGNEHNFHVLRCAGVGCSSFAEIAVVDSNVTTYNDNGLTAGTSYTYRVIASNPVGNANPSNDATATTIVPAAPTGLAATTTSATQINLTWTDAATTETGYEVERCIGAACTDFALLATLGVDAASHEDTGLIPLTTYRYRVRAFNASGPSAYSAIVTAATNLPIAASGLAVVATDANTIGLSWTDNSGNETGFIIERCTGFECSSFAQIQIVGANATAYSDGGLSAGEWYSYRVKAFNASGPGEPSNTSTTNTSAASAPTDLASATQNGTSIQLTWTDNSNNELGFEIERCVGAGCGADPGNFALVTTAAANATTYLDNISIDQSYCYRVRATNNVTNSAYSDVTCSNTLRPAIPTTLLASTISANQIELTWVDVATNEEGYIVERCAGVGCTDFATVQTLGLDANNHQDGSLAPETVYRYRVIAFNVAGQSDPSNIASATTILPGTPTNALATTFSATQVNLQWARSSENEDGFRVERCTGIGCSSTPGAFVQVGTTTQGDTTFENTGLSQNNFYSYRIRAFNAAGTSPYSDVATTNTFLPASPTGLTATTVFGTRIDLAWGDPATNENGFSIERCVGAACADFLSIATVDSNTTSHQDLTAVIGTAYRYRVVAFNGVGPANSNIASANTNVPNDPTNLVAVPTSTTQINLAWNDNSANETGFRVQRCVGAGCSDFAQIAELPANTTTYQNSSIASDQSFSYRVVAYRDAAAGNGSSGFSNVATATTILPAAPSLLIATAISNTRIDLSWTDNANNENGFLIERCSGTDCSPVFMAHPFVGPDATTYSDLGLTPGTSYTYRVRAFNGAGTSPYTNNATAASTVPAIPTDLVATTISASRIDLAWTDNADNETGYAIERCEGVGCSNFTLLRNVGAGADSIQDSGLLASVTYRYRVRAFNDAGPSGYSNLATASTNSPADPTGLAGTTISATQIDLVWVDNADNEASYRVERCDGVGCSSFVEIAQLAANANTYSNTGLTPEVSYTYRVRAVNAAGFGLSAEVVATTLTPTAPSTLAAQTFSATRIDLTWADNSNNEAGFEIERCLGDPCSDFALIETVGAGVTSYQNTGLQVGMSFTYRVRAINAAGASAYSNTIAATTNLPLAPTNLTATTFSSTAVNLAWDDNALNEQGYVISFCATAGCSDFVEIDTVAADINTYQHSGLVLGQSYSYRIHAFNAAGESEFSNNATATTFLPAAPSALATVVISSTQIDVTWTDNADNETGFEIEACTGVGCAGNPSNFALIGTASADATLFNATGLTLGETYAFRVRAVRAAGPSGYSNAAIGKLLVPADPTLLVATTASATQINLSWTDNADDETGYTVERCQGAGCESNPANFTQIASLAPNAVGYEATGLTIGNSYSFRVRAFNVIGTSGYSNSATATTFLPAAPTALTATTLNGSQIDLSWTDNSDNELGFRIERCLGGGCGGEAFVEIATVGAGIQTFSDMTPALNNTYTYRVRSFNMVGTSAYTNESTANTILPAAPTALSATAISGQQIDLAWTDNADNETGFEIERCSGVGCGAVPSNFAQIATVGADVVSYQDQTAQFGTPYSYRVRAVGVAGASAYAGVANASTVLNSPSAMRAWVTGRTSVRIRWNDNSLIESGYQIERCTGEGCSSNPANFSLLTTAAANDTSFSDNGLAANTSYTYRVRGETSGGVSSYTGVAGSRTPMVIGTNNTQVALADTSRGERFYVVAVPAGGTLVVTMNAPAGDADMYVRRGAPPVPGSVGAPNDTICVPYTGNQNEGCGFIAPGATTDYYIMVHGFQAYSSVRLSTGSVWTLVPCGGAVGAAGPTPAACTAQYAGTNSQGVVNVVSGMQDIILPLAGTYRITAIGAQGASGEGSRQGGRPTFARGEFALTAYSTVRNVVGQMGTGQGSGSNGGGGGGTFVLQAGVLRLVGGGGGGARVAAAQNGCDATTSQFGVSGAAASTSACTVKVVGLGVGGGPVSESWGAGGAGYNGNGVADAFWGGASSGGSGAASLYVGGIGNTTSCGSGLATEGGFGGGGSGNGCWGGGGGGGYSGGDGGWIAGGGGTYVTGANASAGLVGLGLNGGRVTIQWIGP